MREALSYVAGFLILTALASVGIYRYEKSLWLDNIRFSTLEQKRDFISWDRGWKQGFEAGKFEASKEECKK